MNLMSFSFRPLVEFDLTKLILELILLVQPFSQGGNKANQLYSNCGLNSIWESTCV